MRRALALVLVAAGLVVATATGAAAEDPPEDPTEVDCPVDHDWSTVGGFAKNSLDKLPGVDTKGNRKVALDKNAPVWFRKEAWLESKWGNCNLAEHVWQHDCKTLKGYETDNDPNTDGYDDGLVPDVCVGTYPASNYNINYDQGGFTEFDRKIWGSSTGFIFSIGKTFVQIGLWGIRTAFSVKISDYTAFVKPMAKAYQDNIVGPMGLNDLAWMILMSFVAFKALTGKIGIAAGEFLFAMIMIGLATALSANVTGYMEDLSDRLDEVSVVLLNAAVPDSDPPKVVAGQGANAVPKAVDNLESELFKQFVEQPYYYINWGGPEERVNDSEYCKARLDHIVAAGMNDDGGWAWNHLGGQNGQCKEAVNFNRNPSTKRFVGALLSTVVSGVVMVTLLLMALTMLMSKFLLMMLFAVWPLAAWGAALPGGMRRVSWSWISVLVQTVIAYEGMALGLSMSLIGTTTILEVTEKTAKGSLAERYLFLLIVVATFGIGLRRGVLAASKNVAERMNDNLTRLSPAAANWQDRHRGGLNLAGADRPIAAAAAGGARMVQTRMAERRVARRSLRNLEEMERRREAPMAEYKSSATGPPPAPAPKVSLVKGNPTPPATPTPPPGGGNPGGHQPGAHRTPQSRYQRYRAARNNGQGRFGAFRAQMVTSGTAPIVGGGRQTNGGAYMKIRMPTARDWRNPVQALAIRARARTAPFRHARADRQAQRWWG